MSSRALLVIAALAACHGRAAPPRERVLARIPGDARVVIAADGPVLAAPRVRAVVDVLRPRWPQSFGCVIDAALASDHAAASVGEAGELVVVIATRAKVTCPMLSKLEEGLWAATLGAARPAAGGRSVLDDPAHARARTYLLEAPLAAEVILPGARVLATAGIDPLEAWLAIDVPEEASALAEQKVRGVVDKLARTNATAALADRIAVSHEGPQVIARLAGPVDVDLASAVRAALAILEAPDATKPRAVLVCPALAPPIVGCAAGTALTATSLAAALAPLAAAPVTPIIENERVASLRLDAPVPSLGLRTGDLVLAIDGRHVTSAGQLGEQLSRARGKVAITLMRDAATAALEVTESRF